ncbi:MAG: ABC transporter ATP-binding protein [Candidatus Dadabacteria bacterium]|nr:ABC transporter ATP-binding protein [Candidatus Dadabacteria bacterium]
MIEIKNVTKRFGKLTAVDSVSLSAREGEAVSLLGMNGAGKSTLLKCVLGLLDFTGDITVNGLSVRGGSKQAKALIGYLPQEPVFYDMRAIDVVRFFGRIRRAGPGECVAALEKAGLSAHALKYASELSGGMRQRLSFAVALLSSPRFLLLDEPTSNLDAGGRTDFLRLIKEYKEKGNTVIFSSHRLGEVDYLADRAVVMRNGKIVFDGKPEKLRRVSGAGTKVSLRVSESDMMRAEEALARAGIKVSSRNGSGLVIDAEESGAAIPVTVLAARGVSVLGFGVEEPTMESILEGAGGNGS